MDPSFRKKISVLGAWKPIRSLVGNAFAVAVLLLSPVSSGTAGLDVYNKQAKTQERELMPTPWSFEGNVDLGLSNVVGFTETIRLGLPAGALYASDFAISSNADSMVVQTDPDVQRFAFGSTRFLLAGNNLTAHRTTDSGGTTVYDTARNLRMNGDGTRVVLARIFYSSLYFLEVWDLQNSLEFTPTAGGPPNQTPYPEYFGDTVPFGTLHTFDSSHQNQNMIPALSEDGKRVAVISDFDGIGCKLEVHNEDATAIGVWSTSIISTEAACFGYNDRSMDMSSDGTRIVTSILTPSFKGMKIFDEDTSSGAWTPSDFTDFMNELPTAYQPGNANEGDFYQRTRLRLSGDGSRVVINFRLNGDARLLVYEDDDGTGGWVMLGDPLSLVKSVTFGPTFVVIQTATLNEDGSLLGVVSTGERNYFSLLQWDGSWVVVVSGVDVGLGLTGGTDGGFRVEFTKDSKCIVVNTGKGMGPVKVLCLEGTVPSGSSDGGPGPSQSQSPHPTSSPVPSAEPSARPSASPAPSNTPSTKPSLSPAPSDVPSLRPSKSSTPSDSPSARPSSSLAPSRAPSLQPSKAPSAVPSLLPSVDTLPNCHEICPCGNGNNEKAVVCMTAASGTHITACISMNAVLNRNNDMIHCGPCAGDDESFTCQL